MNEMFKTRMLIRNASIAIILILIIAALCAIID